MGGITRDTPLFLYDFDAKTISGPMTAAGAVALDLEPDAWRGRFPAQLKFSSGGAAPFATVRVNGTVRYKSGVLDAGKTADLLQMLREAS